MKKFNKNQIIVVASVVLFILGLAGPTVALAYTVYPNPLPVPLLSAGNFVILGKTAITNETGASDITGDLGLSPAAASYLTGFSQIMDASNTFSTSGQVTGRIYAADYTPPTPAYMTTAISAMEAAFTDAAGRTPNATNIGVTTPGIFNSSTSPASTFGRGVYKWTTDVVISDDITLDGSATDVWIFQIDGGLTLEALGSIDLGVKINLTGGALPSNVFWQVAGEPGVILGTYSTFNGTILSLKYITMQTGAVLNGRALAQTAVTLIGNTIEGVAAPSTASLTVTKTVVNTGGGTKVVSNFPLFIDGFPVTSGVASSTSLGSHTVSETSDSGYTSIIAGDCASSGTITLSPGVEKTCTITNTYIIPSSSSGGRTHYGCKDPNASNYDYFSASNPSLCVYAVATTITAVATTTAPVFIPKLPNTGIAPNEGNTPLNIAIMAGLFAISIFFYFTRRKQTSV